MIVFELICTDRHRFEGWFASAGDFEGQKARGLLSCPVCSDSGIEKLLTAKIGRPEAEPSRENAQASVAPAAPPRNLHEFIDAILLNTENVGKIFPPRRGASITRKSRSETSAAWRPARRRGSSSKKALR